MERKIKVSLWILLITSMLPVGWLIFWYVVTKEGTMLTHLVTTSQQVETILLLLWPSSFMLIGDPTDTNIPLRIFAVATNFLFYLMLGALLFLYLTRKRVIFLMPVALFYSWWMFYVVF